MKGIANVITFVTACIIGLFLMEIAVRVLDVYPRPMAALKINNYQLSENKIIGYEYIPNYQAVDGFFDSAHRGIMTNSDGFRDYNYDRAKPKGTFRILAIGDSTTAGNGVANMDDTFPKILERKLNADSRQTANYEVLNMGVGGYHTMQEVETLRVKGLPYKPDLVILTVCLNDFQLHADGGVYHRLIKKTKSGQLLSRDSSVRGLLLRNSRLAFVLYHRFSELIKPKYGWYTNTVLKGKSTVEAGFELLSELQKMNDFTVKIFILPTFRVPFDRYQDSDIHNRVLEAAKGKQGIEVIDLLNGFSELNNVSMGLSHDGMHLNMRGHKVMARLLLPEIRKVAEAGLR